ncbi:hypothetical protein NE562_13315, partial [Butyricicoccus faecihominis]|uniref:hypothetical protein n=1 Tax=Butyricicoccus faecihominis TaxID=1712515 RepID=UPI002478D0D8
MWKQNSIGAVKKLLQTEEYPNVILNEVKNLARSRGIYAGNARSREILRRFASQNDKIGSILRF